MDRGGLVTGIARGWGSGPHKWCALLRILNVGIDRRGMVMIMRHLLTGGQARILLITRRPTLGVLTIHREIVCRGVEVGRLRGRT